FVTCTVTSDPAGTLTVLGLMYMSPSVKLRVTGFAAATCPVLLAAAVLTVLLSGRNSFTLMSPTISPSASATLMTGIIPLNADRMRAVLLDGGISDTNSLQTGE